MSEEYDRYLSEHVSNVKRSLNWMLDNISNSRAETLAIEEALLHDHDYSKYSISEYDQYDNYFYGERTDAVKFAFDNAWLHHIHHNPHHWQHWVLLEDDPENGLPFKALHIPLPFVYEMIADWWSFSWKSGNLFEIFNWYAEHAPNQLINSETRAVVENILKKIWDVLIMQETARGRDISDIEAQYKMFWIEQKPNSELFEYAPNSEDLEHSSAQVIGKVVDIHETENGLEVTVEHSDTEDDEDLYGIPELKKFPMPDKKHVKSAIRFFNYVDPKHEKELADAILKKAKEYGLKFDTDISVGDDNRFKKYLSDSQND